MPALCGIRGFVCAWRGFANAANTILALLEALKKRKKKQRGTGRSRVRQGGGVVRRSWEEREVTSVISPERISISCSISISSSKPGWWFLWSFSSSITTKRKKEEEEEEGRRGKKKKEERRKKKE